MTHAAPIRIVADHSQRGVVVSPSKDTIARAQQGGRTAQEEVFAYLYPLVRKHLFFSLSGRDQSLVDEFTQESMLRIFRALPDFRGEARLSTWALQIAIRLSRKGAARSRRLDFVPIEDWHETGFVNVPSATASQITSILHKIGRKKREAFVLMELLEMTATEAAQVLGVPANTAASRSRHAKSELRTALKEPQP